MRAITIMYDSLNKGFLNPYGCKSTYTPNFQRLAERTAVFDNFYAGSLPCMPARRELHTGRYNFLHRSWGPVEPFDVSAPRVLSENGIYTHFISDHAHYWQDGGLTYHSRYSTYEFIRGQEGDFWTGDSVGYHDKMDLRRQDSVNREHMRNEEDHPHVKCFRSAMKFLETNVKQDNWSLHLEYFDPHEPFFVPEKYKKLYTDIPTDVDWAPYSEVDPDNDTELKQVRENYFALLTMCDEYLGRILDFMDEHDMWKDTMLIVNTDHGYLLGEHGYVAKNYMPTYNEIAKLPFFLWDPVSTCSGERRDQLCQTIDIAPTLLDYFGLQKPEPMLGKSLLEVVRDGKSLRDYALFGYFGKHVNITDGKYVYMRSAVRKHMELNNYTLMPTHIYTPFTKNELRKTDRSLYQDFTFTDGIPVMCIPASEETSPDNSCYWFDRHVQYGNLLFDLERDPRQNTPVEDLQIEQKMISAMRHLMIENEAPPEQFVRLGFDQDENTHGEKDML